MKLARLPVLFLLVSTLLFAFGTSTSTSSRTLPSAAEPLTYEPAQAARQSSPAMFIENVGQFSEEARFQVRGDRETIWLATDAVWITAVDHAASSRAVQEWGAEGRPAKLPRRPDEGVNIRLSFVGANPRPQLEPFGRLGTHVSYFLGNDPAGWHRDVPTWSGVRYRDLYPGIDLEIAGENGQVVQRLVLRDGAAAGTEGAEVLEGVLLRVEGADGQTQVGDRLLLDTTVGRVSLPLLEVVSAGGVPLPLSVGKPELVLDGAGGTAATEILARSAVRDPLVDGRSVSIAPTDNPSSLLYSTFLGGDDSDYGEAIAVDTAGHAYVTGATYSDDFPTTPGAFDPNRSSGYSDAFVAKLNPAATELVYATFLGGSLGETGYAIALDMSDNVIVAGFTSSIDFPATSEAFDVTHNGEVDAFIAKLNVDGTNLVYATFVGGSGQEDSLNVYDLAVDEASDAYLVGTTRSIDFPTTPNVFGASYNGGYSDAFVVKLSADGANLVYATFLGGSGQDDGAAIALDGEGNAYLTGLTVSADFPVTPGALGVSHAGYVDAFVARVNDTGTALTYATYLGGGRWDSGADLAVDGTGCAYVVGRTESDDFPVTPGAFHTTQSGGEDAFIAKLSADGAELVYATFLGGSSLDRGYGIALDTAGRAVVAGYTSSTDFPTTPEGLDTSYNGSHDALLAKLSTDGTRLTYATFLGGSEEDSGRAIVLDGLGNAYVTGYTLSDDFPTTAAAFSTTPNGGFTDAYVAKILPYAQPQATFDAWPTTGIAPLTVVFTNTSTGDYSDVLWDFGDGATDTSQDAVHVYSAPGAYTVKLTVSGMGGDDTDVKLDYIRVWRDLGYLPVVLRDAGPPPAPVLAPIDNSDGDGNYSVSWGSVSGATAYLLQEDDDSTFTSPATVYSGGSTSRAITGRSIGTYWYRVQATNSYGTSPWSNVVSAQVTQSPAPTPTPSPGASVLINNNCSCQLTITGMGSSISVSAGSSWLGTRDPGTYYVTISGTCIYTDHRWWTISPGFNILNIDCS